MSFVNTEVIKNDSILYLGDCNCGTTIIQGDLEILPQKGVSWNMRNYTNERCAMDFSGWRIGSKKCAMPIETCKLRIEAIETLCTTYFK